MAKEIQGAFSFLLQHDSRASCVLGLQGVNLRQNQMPVRLRKQYPVLAIT
jgi:hypothetical protein